MTAVKQTLFVYATAPGYLKATLTFTRTFLQGFHWRSLKASSAIVKPIITAIGHTCTLVRSPTKTLLNLNVDSFQLPGNKAYRYIISAGADISKALDATITTWECAEYEQQIGELYQFISYQNVVPDSNRTVPLQVLQSMRSSRSPKQNYHWRFSSDILPLL